MSSRSRVRWNRAAARHVYHTNMRGLVRVGECLMFLTLVACATRPPGIMTWSEYSWKEEAWPYVLDLSSGHGRLLYFGAAHSFDPADPQMRQIEEAWTSFHADIAFTEGGFPPIESSRDEAVKKAGEPGLVRFLAARDDVPTTTLDPSRPEEVAHLATSFSREQIKLFFVLRSVMQLVQRSAGTGVDDEAARLLAIYGGTPGLRGSPRTVTELQDAYVKYFPKSGHYSGTPKTWFDPVQGGTFLNEIARVSSEYRDMYIVRLLVQHVREGQRVFAVIGGSHVVMQEPALRSQFRRIQGSREEQ